MLAQGCEVYNAVLTECKNSDIGNKKGRDDRPFHVYYLMVTAKS